MKKDREAVDMVNEIWRRWKCGSEEIDTHNTELC